MKSKKPVSEFMAGMLSRDAAYKAKRILAHDKVYADLRVADLAASAIEASSVESAAFDVSMEVFRAAREARRSAERAYWHAVHAAEAAMVEWDRAHRKESRAILTGAAESA